MNDVVDQVVEASRALAVAGQGDLVWGHASVRDPGGRGAWMKSSGWGFEEINAERVVLVSAGGDVLAGHGPRHAEYPIHTQILAARPDVTAVVHSHPTSAVAFASLDVPLRAVSHDAVFFLDPDVPRFTKTSNLIVTDELGAALADALGDAGGVLIPGHGLVTAGETVAEAVMRAVLLNRACATQLTAMAAGGPARWSPEAEVRAKGSTLHSTNFFQNGYDYLIRRAAAGPGADAAV